MPESFTEWLVIFLISVLFFKDIIGNFLKQFLSKKFGLKMNGNGAPGWAQKLEHHYNEETTEILKDIRNGINKLDEREERQCKKLDTVINRLNEQDKYGVKIRKV